MARTRNKQKGGGVAAAVLCFVLVAIVALGAVWGTGFALTGKANPAEWSISNNAPNTDAANGTPTDGMTVTEGAANLMRLRSLPMTATSAASTDSTYYLTATVEPADADEQELEWLLDFANPASSWASGKVATDFVSVAPTSDTHNATVTCLGSFGEPIVITVRSKDNPEATATCTCDYVKRVNMVTFTLLSELSINRYIEYSYSLEESAYTIDSEFDIENITCFMEIGFLEDIKSRLGSKADYIEVGNSRNISTQVDKENKRVKIGNTDTPMTFFSFTDSFYEDLGSEHEAALKTEVNNAFKASVKSFSGQQMTMKIKYSSSYNDKVYFEAEKSIAVNFKYEYIKITVANVNLDTNHIPM